MITPIINTQIFNINAQKKSSPTFASRLPNDVFESAKDIPHLRCAYCGKVMLTNQECQDIIESFRLTGNQLLKTNKLDEFKDKEIYGIIGKFVKNNPKQSLYKIMNNPVNKALMTTLNTIDEKDWDKIKKIAQNSYVNSEKFVKKLEKYSNLFNDDSKELFEVLKNYSKQYPDKTFSEILNLPKIKNYHTSKHQRFQKETTEINTNVFENIEKYKEKLENRDKSIVREALYLANKDLTGHNYNNLIKKQYYIYCFEKRMSKISDQNIAQKILNELNKLPEKNCISHFLIKKNINDFRLLEKIFQENLQISYEHIKARKHDAVSKKRDGIYMHRACNYKKGSLPYPFLLTMNPQMPQFIQNQISRLSSFIKSRKLIGYGYDTYPIEVKNTIYGQSGNKISIKIKNFLKYVKETLERKIIVAKMKAKNAKTNKKDLYANISCLKSKLKNVEKLIEREKLFNKANKK